MGDYELALVKEVGEREVVLVVGDKEYTIPLSKEEAEGLHYMLLNYNHVLLPFNEFDRKIALNQVEHWNEEYMPELEEDDTDEVDEDGKVIS